MFHVVDGLAKLHKTEYVFERCHFLLKIKQRTKISNVAEVNPLANNLDVDAAGAMLLRVSCHMVKSSQM